MCAQIEKATRPTHPPPPLIIQHKHGAPGLLLLEPTTGSVQQIEQGSTSLDPGSFQQYGPSSRTKLHSPLLPGPQFRHLETPELVVLALVAPRKAFGDSIVEKSLLHTILVVGSLVWISAHFVAQGLRQAGGAERRAAHASVGDLAGDSYPENKLKTQINERSSSSFVFSFASSQLHSAKYEPTTRKAAIAFPKRG